MRTAACLIDSDSDNNLIGGTTAACRQRDLGQRSRGVHLSGGSSDNLVEGNLIGTNAAGKAAVGQRDSGVLIDSGSGLKHNRRHNRRRRQRALGQPLLAFTSPMRRDNLVEGNLDRHQRRGQHDAGRTRIDGVLIDGGVGEVIRSAGPSPAPATRSLTICNTGLYSPTRARATWSRATSSHTTVEKPERSRQADAIIRAGPMDDHRARSAIVVGVPLL